MMDQILFESNECYDLRVDGLFQIGRSPLCQAILRDTHVSKMHCSLNIRSKDDSSSSVDSEFKVMITDHSSNGTWISTGGKTLKLEKEKSTLLKEGDVILLTRFTRANHEAFGYKYLSTPFPRVIKCIYKKVADKASIPKYEESNVQICDGKSIKTVERASKRDSQGRTVNQNGGKNICRTSATFVRSTGSPDAKRYNENHFNVYERKFETTSKAGKTRSGSFKSCDAGREEHVCSRARSDEKNRPTMKRKDKADKQYFRSRKLRFKSQTEERPEPRSCYHDDKPVKKREFHKEAATNQCVALAADRVPGKDSCTKFTKEKYTSANTSNEQIASNKIEGITHSSSSLLVMKESDNSNILSRSESPSKLPKSAKAEEKCTSLLTESTGKSDKLEQSCGNFDISTSMCLDRIEYGKCVHCGKFIPSVTISLHEAVCEGQSQEAKSQDHVPLSSLPLEDCLFAVSHSKSDSHITEKLTTSGDEKEIEEGRDLVHEGSERKLGEDEGVTEQAEDKTAAKKNLEAHRSSLGNSHDVLGKSNERVIAVAICKSREIEGLNLDETPDQKTLQTSKNLPSASPYVLERCTTLSEDMNTAATGTCKSAKCEGKFLTEPVPASTKKLELKESVTDQETGSISAHRNPPALEKEESNERCTFCSALFPLPDLILHVSTCSATSAVPCTDSSDSESEQEACPYCGKSFDVLDLVEHAEHCKPTLSTTISAREIRQNDWLPSSLMERGSLPDPVVKEESPVRDKELCPKCHGEFALLELVNHADKCTGEGSSVGVGLEASRVGENGHCFDGSHSDRGLDITVDEESLSDAESDSNYDTSKDEDGIRYGEGWRHSRSRSGSDSENSFSSSISGKVNERKDEGENEGSFIDAAHKGIVDVGDDTTYGGHDYSDSDGETSIHKSPTKDDDHEHVGMETSADDSDSDEFEFCPNCRKPFHLSRLIEHASNCTSVFPAVKTSSESRSCPGRSEPSDSSTLTPTVFTNCAQCGKRLTVDLLAVHYSECGKLNATEDERKSREAEESHLESILEPFDCRDNLSSRVEVESDRRENRPAISSETFTLKKAPSTTESEVSSFSDDSSKDDETTTLSFKRKLSSLDSYQECEEQCMFCLKMFAVSALVEHVCACATNQAAKDDLEQCCYCYQTFPLSKLITHAESCVKKTAFSQENSQSCMTHSQSASAELMERCMYCFKDFPVSKLIIHSQKCDGDMSGPRERFQGFIPSVHDLSAISSDAILTDTQRAALQYVISRSAQDSKNVFSGLLARVQRLGYSENDLTRTLQWVRSAAPIIIHINLDRVLRFLVEDTHYRNQFETGTSGGSTDLAARRSWEDRIFNNSYRHSSPSERVKYGVLNIVGDPRGVRRCSCYGDSFLQLKKVRLRTTFASMDTSGAGVKLSCCEHYENVLYSYTNGEITAIMDVATGKVPFHRSDCISNYKEVQIHGPVSLSENVECIVANARHQTDPRIESLLYLFVEQNKCNLIWMDPDDMAGAAPLRLGPSLGPSFLTAELSSISRLSRGRIDRERAISKRSNSSHFKLALGLTQYLSMFLGTLVLAVVADVSGRLKTLFACLVIAFIGGLSSAFAFNSQALFIVLRGVAGFATGGAFPIIFILSAEYVSPRLRAVVLCTLWASTTLAILSLAGIACVIQKRQVLMLTMTLPLLLAALLWRIVPESPRWVLLHSKSSGGMNEAQGLLDRAVTEEERRTSQYGDCLAMWGKFYSPPEASKQNQCFSFLRLKEPRRITIILGLAWFAVGLLYRGLDTSSIQLLENFYANYAVRELVNLLGFSVFLILVTWTGRRASTVIAMVLAGVFCLIFSVASDGFLKSERATVVAVIQLIGRLCVMVSLASLSLYSIELFPTVVRCSAMGLITSIGFLGIAVCPLIMKIEVLAHAVVPLGVMGCLSLTTGLLCHFLLPRTKGSTAETFEDGSDISRFMEWSPRVQRTQTKLGETEVERVEMIESCADEFSDMRQSWEVSFDRISRTSRWEILSYEDAKRKSIYSFAVDQSLDEESHLLSEDDIDKLARHVPSSTWVLAYSTFQHGMSLKTLYHRLREVETPVLLVVKDNNGFIFGVFSPISPRMDPNFCGFGKSYFFTCKPKFKIYPCSGKNSYYMTGDSGGLAFGCSEGTFGLWLDSELYHGRSTACDTYNSEMLSATEDFTCLGVEVWTFA